jgi:hypothetical protein
VELLRRTQSAEYGLTYVFVCVELGYGILGEPDENPTVVEAVRFQSENSELEKMDTLEDIGLCDGQYTCKVVK